MHRNSKPGPAMTPKKSKAYQATMPRPAYCMASASSLQKPRALLIASTTHSIQTLYLNVPHRKEEDSTFNLSTNSKRAFCAMEVFKSPPFLHGDSKEEAQFLRFPSIGIGHRNELHKDPRSSLASKASKS
jgi:hypothetical protein